MGGGSIQSNLQSLLFVSMSEQTQREEFKQSSLQWNDFLGIEQKRVQVICE